MGRKAIQFDLKQIERLAGLGLTPHQIAISLGVSQKTIERRMLDSGDFVLAMERGVAHAHVEVANVLYDAAVKKNDTVAAIFFAKARMGWRDRDATIVVDGLMSNDPNLEGIQSSLSGLKKQMDGTASRSNAGAISDPSESENSAPVRKALGQDDTT